MLYQLHSPYSVEETCKRVEGFSMENKFGVLGIHNLKQKINDKGLEFTPECRVIEVCNPMQAKTVLDVNMTISTMLPCRISVYEDKGKTVVATIRPSFLISQFPPNSSLKEVAINIEKILEKIISDTCNK